MTDQLERIPLDVIEHVFFSKSPSKKELMPEITGEENDFTVIKVSDPPKKASPKKEFYDRIPSEMIRHKIPSVFYDKKKLPEVDIFEGRRFYSHPKSLLRLPSTDYTYHSVLHVLANPTSSFLLQPLLPNRPEKHHSFHQNEGKQQFQSDC